jgi:DNA-binding response OmpR family regulator
MRFLIIDDSPEYRRLLRYHLDVRWPDAIIDEHHPTSPLDLPATLEVDDYDLVLLGHPLKGETGYEWLKRLRGLPDCPPVLVFADPSDEFAAVDALKSGAGSFFPKARVTHQRLIATIQSELGRGSDLPDAETLVGRIGRGTAHNYELVKTLHSSKLASVYLARSVDVLLFLVF